MKSGKCPKCGSILVFQKRTQSYHSMLSLGFIKGTYLTDYICADCGYTEQYATDKKVLENIKKNWDKVKP